MTLLGIKEGGKAVHYYQTKTDKCNSFQMGIEEDTVAMMEAEEEGSDTSYQAFMGKGTMEQDLDEAVRFACALLSVLFCSFLFCYCSSSLVLFTVVFFVHLTLLCYALLPSDAAASSAIDSTVLRYS